jgi:hypothetical protein
MASDTSNIQKDLRHAFNELEEVVKKIIKLQGHDDSFVADYCTVVAVQKFDQHDRDATSIVLLPPGGDNRVPFYRIHGLLSVATEEAIFEPWFDEVDDDDNDGD